MSNLPVWAQASSAVAQAGVAAGQLLLGIRLQREKAASEWAQQVQDLSGHSEEELSRILSEDPLVTQIVSGAWEAAARTASASKRLTLARIVAAVFDGDIDDADLDPIPLLLKAVEALDEPHIRLLAIIAMPHAGAGDLRGTLSEGSWTLNDLQRKWTGAGDLIEPLLSALEREGLVHDVGSRTYDGESSWDIRTFGRRLIRFLPDITQDQLSTAELVAVQLPPEFIAIRNLGPAKAQDVRIIYVRRRDGATTVLPHFQPLTLPPGATWRMDAWPPEIAPDHGPYRVCLGWYDDQGDHEIVRKVGAEVAGP
jgi:hypothetical protein